MRKEIRLLGAATTALLMFSTAEAQQQALPKAADIIDKYVEVVHLRNLLAHSSVRKRGTVEVPAQGIKGTLEIANAKPFKVFQKLVIEGLGESRRGYDGTYAWDLDLLTGPRLRTGTELTEAREESGYGVSLRDSLAYKTRETVEIADRGGEKCYRVRMVSNGGKETFDCFSVATGLLVSTEGKVNSRMGPVDNLVTYTDYKDFGGILFATKATQSVLQQVQVVTLVSVEYDTVKPEEFELPAPIKALIKPDTGSVRR